MQTIGEQPTIPGVEVEIPIDDTVKPVRQPFRRLPLHLMDLVSEEVKRLLRRGIIEECPNGVSEWQSPVTPVKKSNGDFRLCIDMRAVNKAVKDEKFPLLTLQLVQSCLVGCTIFSVIDLKEAFFHVPLSKRSRGITTFVTNEGAFRFKVLLFGLKTASEIFQKVMTQVVLKGLEGVLIYIDDIIVYGRDVYEHNKRLRALLKALDEFKLAINLDKLQLAQPQVKFMGHLVSADGIRPLPERIELVRRFEKPRTRTDMNSFLGLVAYIIGNQQPRLSELTTPMRRLAAESDVLKWNEKAEKEFQELKDAVQRSVNLGFFRRGDRTKLYADASPTALGAILVQIDQEGTRRVVSCASRKLKEVEQRYSHTDKEALALVWAITRFDFFLRGTHFELITDHQALESLFRPKSKPSPRLERWLMAVQDYNFSAKHIPGKQQIADCFSRLLKIDESTEDELDAFEEYIAFLAQAAPCEGVTIEEIRMATSEDKEMKQIQESLDSGVWPTHLTPLKNVHDELCWVDGILLRGFRIMIPASLRAQIINLLHEGHPGLSRTVAAAREKVWWPKITEDIKAKLEKCTECKMVNELHRPGPMQRHCLPDEAWTEIGMDFFGPLPDGRELLVLVDYYSRFPIVKAMRSTTAHAVIETLEEIFSDKGNPKVIRVDNEPPFQSTELRRYLAGERITLENSIPYWPRMNGLVERMNRSIKACVNRSLSQGTDWWKDLQQFLKMYRSTPHTTTGQSPMFLMSQKEMRTKIPSAKEVIKDLDNDSDLLDRDRAIKERGRVAGDAATNARKTQVTVGDTVLIKSMTPGTKWSPKYLPALGTALEAKGDSCLVEVSLGDRYRRNAAHLLVVTGADGATIKRMREEGDTEEQDIDDHEEDNVKSAEDIDHDDQVDTTSPLDLTQTEASQQSAEGETQFNLSARRTSTPLMKRQRRVPLWQQDYLVNQVQELEED